MKQFLCTVVLSIATLTTMASQQPTSPTQGRVPKPSILGEYTRVVLSCKNVVQSMAWWTRLGFTPLPDGNSRPDSAITLTDGQIIITLVKDALPSPILMFASADIRRLKDSLESMRVGVTFDVQGPTLRELRLLSPNGIHISVRPAPQERAHPLSKEPNTVCGMLTEISVATPYLKQEVQYWDILEFTTVQSGVAPYPFANVSDGKVTIGIHENRDIKSVAFTYFAPDMKERIDRLSKLGFTFIDEYKDQAGATEHAFLLSPDDQLVMLFTGDRK